MALILSQTLAAMKVCRREKLFRYFKTSDNKKANERSAWKYAAQLFTHFELIIHFPSPPVKLFFRVNLIACESVSSPLFAFHTQYPSLHIQRAETFYFHFQSLFQRVSLRFDISSAYRGPLSTPNRQQICLQFAGASIFISPCCRARAQNFLYKTAVK